MKLAEVLWGPEAWCQGIEMDTQGRRCLLGALRVIQPKSITAWGEATIRLGCAVDTEFPREWVRINDFNDAPDRTWDDIARVVARYDEMTRAAAVTP